jgi:hypothetical protein
VIVDSSKTIEISGPNGCWRGTYVATPLCGVVKDHVMSKVTCSVVAFASTNHSVRDSAVTKSNRWQRE